MVSYFIIKFKQVFGSYVGIVSMLGMSVHLSFTICYDNY